MGLVIFALTPSFACEKIRLLPMHHAHTSGLTWTSVHLLFIDHVSFILILSNKFRLASVCLFLPWNSS